MNVIMFEEYQIIQAFREQQQLFLWDWSYIKDVLFHPGGLSVLSGRFVVQYFHSPVSALTLTLLALLLLSLIVWKSGGSKTWSLISAVVPSFLLAFALRDLSLHFGIVFAMIISSAMVLLHTCIPYKREVSRLIGGMIGTVIVWFLAGSGAMIFGLSAFVADIRSSKTAWAYPVVALICGWICYMSGGAGQFTRTISPAFYYEITSTMPRSFLILWVSIPLVTVLRNIQKPSSGWLFAGATALLCITAALMPVNQSETEYCHMEYLAANENWEELAKYSRKHMTSYIASNYHNLAKAGMGTLSEDLFKVPQGGPKSLMFISNEHNADPLLAHVMFACGNMAAAQNIAFNTLFSRCGFNPSMMKIVSQVDIMRGDYDVASKYLDILKKAPRYRKWAEAQERVLHNDELVEEDPILGRGRRDIPQEEGFVMDKSPMEELLRIVDANPYDSSAMEYALSYLLLAKDLKNTYLFIDKYYGSPALMSLPTPAQEALLFYSDYSSNVLGDESVSRDYCRSHGVSGSTIERFAKFQQAMTQSGGKAPAGFGNTFWDYMLFTKI